MGNSRVVRIVVFRLQCPTDLMLGHPFPNQDLKNGIDEGQAPLGPFVGPLSYRIT